MIQKATRVSPEGNRTNCVIALVGEQPGKTEVKLRRPFCGPAGMELDSCLNTAGIPRHQCYITNVIKDLDHPLEYYVDFGRKGVYQHPEFREYKQELREELTFCTSNVIVAVGGVALFALCERTGITKWRGSVIESTLLPGKKVVPIVHPATIIPPKMVYLNKRLIINDLIRILKESEYKEIRSPNLNIKIEPSFYECMEFLSKCEDIGLGGGVIFFDIEVYNNEVSCISFAYSPSEAISIPLMNSYGDYFTIEQEMEIWQVISRILENQTIKKGGQNLTFDVSILLSKYNIATRNIYTDTMVNQKIHMTDYPVGLDFITSIHTNIPYYKDEGKKWYKVGGVFKTLWHYNALDSLACANAFGEQMTEIIKQKNLNTVIRQTSIIEPIVYMARKGISVDIEGMRKAGIEMEEQVKKLQKQLDELVGFPINANSPQQLNKYFYETLGHKPYLKDKRPTTDITALIRLSRKGVKEADLVKQIRGLTKLISAYVNLDKLDEGRLKCFYNPAKTVTGRLSSGEDIFDKGMNMQNWPHPLLRFLHPDEGYVYYSFDLSQAENRIVAYVGRIPRMIYAFENGEDLHRITAGLLFGKLPSEISDEEGSSSIGGGRFSERFWGKKSNHSLNYDLGFRNFALITEIPENEAKWLIERFHQAYPEIRGNYHQNIKMQLSKDRTIVNLMGRRRAFLDRWGDDLFKAAYGHLPQSTVADIINDRGLNYIYYNQDLFKHVELLIQVHDSIGFQIPLSCSWKKHAEAILEIKNSLETPLLCGEIEFVIPADLSMGLSLYKEEGIDFKSSKIPDSVEELAKKLEQSYSELKGKTYDYSKETLTRLA
jgi:uracil-DNA glycosylase family 4